MCGRTVDEFDLIARRFAPLAKDPGARGLIDDAAVLRTQGDVIVTTDSLVEGVHFLPDDPLDLVARKALRVNLSDLAGKAAAPFAILLNLIWPQARPAADLETFADGLAQDCIAFDLALLGGDTTATPGPLCISITAFGRAARAPSRAEAKIGDDVWVTGAIGDAYLGLALLRGEALALPADACAFLIARYRLPTPRLALAPLLQTHAHASMDVSDGLLGDAAKMAAASGVRLAITQDAVPLSPAAQAVLRRDPSRLRSALDFGDDYEILFTAGAEARAALAGRATCIGTVTAGAGAALIDGDGVEETLLRGGHRHALGR